MSGEQWFCKVVGQEVGPVSSDDLFDMFERGQIDRTDAVRQGKTGLWRPFDDAFSERFSDEGNVATAEQPTWYFRTLGEEFGPYTVSELEEFIAQGQLSRDDKLREGRVQGWSRAEELLPKLFPPEETSSASEAAGQDSPGDFEGLKDAPAEPKDEPPAKKPERKKKRRATSDEDLAASLLGPPIESSPIRPAARTLPPEPEPAAAVADLTGPTSSSAMTSATPAAPPPPPHYTPPPPPPKSYSSSQSSGGGGGGGFGLANIDFTGTPVKVVGALAASLVVGYFVMSMGLFGSFNAGPVYEGTSVLYADFVRLSENPESPEYEAFYTKFKVERDKLLEQIGHPDQGTTALEVKNGMLSLASAVEAYHRADMNEAERETYKSAADDRMAKLKKIFAK